MKDYEYIDASVLDIAMTDSVDSTSLLDLSTTAFSLAKKVSLTFSKQITPEIEHYPQRNNKILLSAIAEVEYVSPDSIILSSSFSEMIFYVLSVIAPERVLLVGPLFSEYARICRVLSIPYVVHPLDEENGFSLNTEDIQAIKSFHPTLTVLCTPNTITGTIFPIALALHAIASPWIIVDASMKEFVYGTPHYDDMDWENMLNMLRPGTHLLTLHNPSSFFSTNGESLAYLVLKQEQKSLFSVAFPKYSSVSMYTQELYTQCFSSIQTYRDLLPTLKKNMHHFIEVIQSYTIFTALYSTLPLGFITVRLHEDISPSLFYSFLRSHSILVYWCVESTGCKSDIIRIRYMPNAIERLTFALDAFIDTLS